MNTAAFQSFLKKVANFSCHVLDRIQASEGVEIPFAHHCAGHRTQLDGGDFIFPIHQIHGNLGTLDAFHQQVARFAGLAPEKDEATLDIRHHLGVAVETVLCEEALRSHGGFQHIEFEVHHWLRKFPLVSWVHHLRCDAALVRANRYVFPRDVGHEGNPLQQKRWVTLSPTNQDFMLK